MNEVTMLTKEKFISALEAGLNDTLDEKPEEMIKGDETFDSYGVDSLDMMNLLLFLEDELKIDSEDIDNDNSLTPDQLHELIANTSE